MLHYILILIAGLPLLILLIPALLLWLITLPIVIPLQIFSLHAQVLLADINERILRILDPILEVYRDIFARLRTEIRYHLIDKPSEKHAERVRQAEREAERQAAEECRRQHTLIYTAEHAASHIPQPEGKTLIEVAEGIERIPENAFSGWDQMRKITLPSTLKEIGSHAFAGCSDLREINLPNGVIKVGGGAFRSCTALRVISLPETVTELGKDVFARCPELRWVSLSAALRESCMEFLPQGQTLQLASPGDSRWLAIVPPLKRVGPDAVRDDFPRELYFCPGTEIIGDKAFTRCHKLQSVQLPSTLRLICRKAFAGCSNLKTIRIPASVTQIAGNALPRHARIIAEPGSYAYRWAKKRGRLAE